MYNWRFRFKNYQEVKEQKEGIARKDWLPGYVQLFIENCNQAPAVYAQKRGKSSVLTVSYTIALHGNSSLEKTLATKAQNTNFKG